MHDVANRLPVTVHCFHKRCSAVVEFVRHGRLIIESIGETDPRFRIKIASVANVFSILRGFIAVLAEYFWVWAPGDVGTTRFCLTQLLQCFNRKSLFTSQFVPETVLIDSG